MEYASVGMAAAAIHIELPNEDDLPSVEEMLIFISALIHEFHVKHAQVRTSRSLGNGLVLT
jgi:hypothetical protein